MEGIIKLLTLKADSNVLISTSFTVCPPSEKKTRPVD